MKIVLFTAGLGNQIFQYFFSLYLKEKFPQETIFGCYDKNILNNHNGLEIQNVFDIQLPPSSKFSHLLVKLTRALYRRTGWNWLGAHEEPFKDTFYYEGYWHNKVLFDNFVHSLRFRNHIPAPANKQILAEIETTNSVFLHVRRGDYLDPIRSKDFANSCPISYYEKGIQHALSVFSDAKFFVFSDDIDWVKGHIDIPNASFVAWNKGKESFWDMLLMSHCKAGIIANSSFSFWGAMLGKEKAFVVKPVRWIGAEVPPIFPISWISL